MTGSAEGASTLKVEKRDGTIVEFDATKIGEAIVSAAKAAGKSESYFEEGAVEKLVTAVQAELNDRFSEEDLIANVENVHDVVEKHLMYQNMFDVAKSYILYRAEKKRQAQEERKKKGYLKNLMISKSDGHQVRFNTKKVKDTLARLSSDLPGIDVELVFNEAVKTVYDGIQAEDVDKALCVSATTFIESEPDYDILAARLLQQKLRKEVFGISTERNSEKAKTAYKSAFIKSIQIGVSKKILDERMLSFDLGKMADAIVPERDDLIKFIGLQTLYERYFTQFGGKKLETPQIFWMRVAMGLALLEKDKESWAIKFYNALSSLRCISSTPTLFHSGLTHPQLSSCYLTTVDDDLKDIFKSFSDNAQLSKWSGGIGNDWTNVRATGANVRSTMIESQGVIPFLKIANDTTVSINRSGKRHSAVVAYLETWHLDIEDFLALRKNTGDERRRTHDMNTAHWIPDLFFKRVQAKGRWTLFSPDEVPDLHNLYGSAFEKRYAEYETMADAGQLKKFKVLEADKLYRQMLTMIFETGHPWFTFKDAFNVRSPQDHCGVIHSSNLCTEISLNTSVSKLTNDKFDPNTGERIANYETGEVAVCNLSSTVLNRHIKDGKIDYEMLKETIILQMRMLDNVIDLNFYPIPEARLSNMRHRPVGLGIMGFQDVLLELGLAFEQADELVDELQEQISWAAIYGSSLLAKERGAYQSFKGSKWDRGIFPYDTVKLLEEERGVPSDVDMTQRLDWSFLKQHVSTYGMRNSNTMAIAPTATISTIAGCFPSFEPQFKNIYVKANMSGEFTIVNEYLIRDLKKLGLWDKQMLDDLKFHDGSVQAIDRIPNDLKARYKESFEIDPFKLIDQTALRGKWIDQAQSHNIFLRGKSGKLLASVYEYAWKKGLKSTYYLRSLGASQNEKSTLDTAKYGFTQKREIDTIPAPAIKQCRIEDPTCESCQ